MKFFVMIAGICIVAAAPAYCSDSLPLVDGYGTKKINDFAVVINSYSPAQADELQVKGYYIYVLNGREIRKEIDKSGWGYNFEAEYIKEVYVKKINGNGHYQFSIIENDKTIFTSKQTTSALPTIFKKKIKVDE